MTNKIDRSDFYGRTPLIAGNWKMYKSIAEAKEFAKEFKASFTANKDALEEIGITSDDDGKLTINQEKLSGAPGNKLKTVFGDNSGYIKSVTASVDPINDILGKVRALRSSNYNSKGIMF